jgi:hypothetical protein
MEVKPMSRIHDVWNTCAAGGVSADESSDRRMDMHEDIVTVSHEPCQLTGDPQEVGVEWVLSEVEWNHVKPGRLDSPGKPRWSSGGFDLVAHILQKAHERKMEVVQVTVHSGYKQDA